MSSPIIQVENLGKSYRIQHQQRERYTALRDVISSKVRSWVQPAAQRPVGDSEEEFWAIKDLSFEVKEGDVVGIIGRNGAGKSTLLKLLSRITAPTIGRIHLRGRVATLLEVGTGFHPELTGRENVFLNGAILGMTRAEVRAKFDEIVAFAEVERFLDTPVKRYSSGMYVRLAFAVAAHLEPEILIVDEVLAVGDAEFQKKCLGKMKDVSRGGRTVLFVSHNMGIMRNVCQTGILLEQGRRVAEGRMSKVIDEYVQRSPTSTRFTANRNEDSYVTACEVRTPDGKKGPTFFTNEPLQIVVRYRNERSINGLRVGFNIALADGTILLACTPEDEGCNSCMAAGEHEVIGALEPNLFLKGLHQIHAAVWNRSDGTIYDDVRSITQFTMEAARERAYSRETVRPGLVQVPVRWSVKTI